MEQLTEIRYFDSKRENDLSNLLILIENSVEISNILIRNSYNCKDNPSNGLEFIRHNKKSIIYNNKEYPFFILSHNYTKYSIFINEEYFNEHQEEITLSILKAYMCSDNNTINVPDILLNERCIKILSSSNKKLILPSYADKSLFELIKKESNKTVLGYNLNTLTTTLIIRDLNDKDFNGLENIKSTVKIFLSRQLDELESYNYTYELIKYLKEHNINNTIELSLENPNNYLKSKLINIDYPNLVFVDNLGIRYTQKEVLDVNKKLDTMIENLHLDNLSPFEKYIKIYNFVKTYKKYKESKDRKEARSLKLILDNEYIVCIGYINLLKALLNKVNINCAEFPLNYHTNNTSLIIYNHSRIIVNITDEKYRIKGIYYGDPTFEEGIAYNMNFALKPLKYLDHEKDINQSFISLIFNVSNLEHYMENIQYLIRIYEDDKKDSSLFIEALEYDSYKELYSEIRKILIKLDKGFILNIESHNKLTGINYYKTLILEVGKYICNNLGTDVYSSSIVKALIISEKKSQIFYDIYKEYYDDREKQYFKQKK